MTFPIAWTYLVGGIVTDQFNSFSGLSLGGNQSNGAHYFFGGDSVTVTFATPVNAFGIFFNVNQNSGNFRFSTSVGTAIFSSNTNLGSYNIPEIITASVPKPSSLVLGGLGLASCAAWMIRRRLA